MRSILGVAAAGLLVSLISTSAFAAPKTVRVRGTIEAVHGEQLTIKTYAGTTVNLELTRRTKYISVLPAELKDITSGDFVGIGATGPESAILAMEVVIFPASMRGTGEGHYAWSVPAHVADADRHMNGKTSTGAPPIQGTMTNGTVTSTPASAAPPIQGTMTNGTVTTNAHAQGGKELTVGYDHGKTVNIMVPADVPVVKLAPADRSIVSPGAKAFAIGVAPSSGGTPRARFVAVGANGLMPPM